MPWVTIHGHHVFIADKGGVQTPLNQRTEGSGSYARYEKDHAENLNPRELLSYLKESTNQSLRGYIEGDNVHWFDAYRMIHWDFTLAHFNRAPNPDNMLKLVMKDGQPHLYGQERFGKSITNWNHPHLKDLKSWVKPGWDAN